MFTINFILPIIIPFPLIMPRKRKSLPTHDTTVCPLKNNHVQQGNNERSSITIQKLRDTKSITSTNNKSNVTMMNSSLASSTICYDNINEIILPRNNHKKHDSKFNFSESSTTFISSVLFNKESIVLFNNSFKLDTFVTDDFVSKRLKDVMPNVLSSTKMNILRYNESKKSYESLSHNDFFKYVKNGYLTRNRKFNQSKKLLLLDSTKQTRISSKISRGISGIIPGMTKKIIGTNEIYYDYDFFDDNIIWNNWNDFSLIHNMYESFDLIVYSYSHRVKPGDMIHYCTRTKLKFPCNFNCAIIFHGLLVHCGAASKREPTSSCSFSYSNDARMFAHLKKHGESNYVRAQKDKNGINDYKVTSTSTKTFCPQFDGKFCEHCSKIYQMSGVGTDLLDNSNEINVAELFMNSKKSSTSLIYGNLKDDGWAIYKSLDIRKYNKSQLLWSEMDDLINGHSGLSSKWSVVQGTKLKGRCTLSLSDVDIIEKHKHKIESISSYFQLILEEHISKVAGFSNSEFSSMLIIINRGCVIEQNAHSDVEWKNRSQMR